MKHPAQVWNLIAETQPLKTTWAQVVFPMDQEQMDQAIERETEALTEEMGDPVMAEAYLAVMPLLWEAEAIEAAREAGHAMVDGVTPMATVQEAVIAASRDYALTTQEQTQLEKKLRTAPTA